ncbi:sn-glycerol-3-phosphate ABC transporter ATP-binding protein UgpC [Bacillus timonensis]|uniref:sn-glycerol-3-phosphate ABC transporter ATP-binding protein UgpC n=1 Tax=Bacillus timonensis TaxID=1033734 RepID=A0A4S3PVT5_9BACI|nr:sn-glycerol-3-phosphate ABC transporter ATP-binding protein UgpC [Bacillus timonensis]THE13939.1 sn-glycerol-3-phosphate ABC transporter ATP-binding protein UgpC [Bacillus timonensis]
MAYIELNNIYKVYGDKVLAINDFNLHIEENEFIALIGPSGCGKSTLLRMISGLEDISDGDFMIKGKRINNIHAKDRDMAMVFQNYALYPHLSVYDNIAFGLKLRKTSKQIIKQKVHEVAAILGLSDYLEKKPNELSGGQRQRVALGRAMVQDSNIFLMDEPLSNLDAKLRNKMRVEILKLHKQLGVTTIYVTHDQVEAMTMADRIVVMNKGVIQQVGTPTELYNDPNNLFVATFIGEPEINLIKAKIEKDNIIFGEHTVSIPKVIKNVDQYQGKEVYMGIRAENFRTEGVYLEAHSNEVITSNIQLIEMRGDHFIVVAEIDNQNIYLKVPANQKYALGDNISYVVNYNKLLLFDADTGERIR